MKNVWLNVLIFLGIGFFSPIAVLLMAFSGPGFLVIFPVFLYGLYKISLSRMDIESRFYWLMPIVVLASFLLVAYLSVGGSNYGEKIMWTRVFPVIIFITVLTGVLRGVFKKKNLPQQIIKDQTHEVQL